MMANAQPSPTDIRPAAIGRDAVRFIRGICFVFHSLVYGIGAAGTRKPPTKSNRIILQSYATTFGASK